MSLTYRYIVRLGFRGGLVITGACVLDHFKIHDAFTLLMLSVTSLCAVLSTFADLDAEEERRNGD